MRVLLAAVMAWMPVVLGAVSVQPLGPGLTAQDLAQALVGPGVSISNVSYVGATIASGTFNNALGAIGIDQGVLLTCGSIYNAPGPNNQSGASASNGLPGDADLTVESGYPTNDASVLEFDFIPLSSQVTFDFVFGSEEYPEFIYSFNDAFAIYVNGVNVALVPGTSVPVTIFNVNAGMNAAWYIDNTGGLYDLQLDGFTRVIQATANVNVGVVNHIKFAIADAVDYALDSMVFIRAGSLTAFTATPTLTVTDTPGPSPTITPTPSITPTFSSSPSRTSTPSTTPTPSPSPSRTVTPTFSITPTFSVSPSFTHSPTVTLTSTITPTFTPTPLPLLLTPKHPNPNPARDAAWLPYILSVDAEVDIRIFDVAGELVRSFDPVPRIHGPHEQRWDLLNGAGRPVASGVYLCRIRARSGRDEEVDAWVKVAVSR